MRLPPASVIASWPTPNYVDPPTRGPGLLIVNAILFTLVTVAIGGRLYSRIFIRRWFGTDDAWIIPAYICDVGLTAVVMLATSRYDWNRHEWDIPHSMIPRTKQVAFAAKILFCLAACFTRISLTCFYYRLVKDSGIKWFYRVLHVTIAWNVMTCAVFVALAIWLCSPIKAYWVFPPIGHCINEGDTMLGAGIVNSFIDLWTTILPIPIVMRLQMPLRQRIGVCVLLSMGIIVTAAGAVRNYYTWKSLMKSWDTAWWAYYLWVAAAVEIHLGLMCACAPAWKSILQKPVKALSSRISPQVSSLRSRTLSKITKSRSQNPLRSLPRFQMTRFDFEKTRRDSRDDPFEELEKKLDRSKPTCNVQISAANPTKQFDTVGEWDQLRDEPGGIAIRRSVDQSSSRQESPVLPKAWIREYWPDKRSR